jgi:hypothetical protein
MLVSGAPVHMELTLFDYVFYPIKRMLIALLRFCFIVRLLYPVAMVLSVLIPQVRPAHKYPNSPRETNQPPGGDNAVCVYPHKVYTAECEKSLTATYQCKTPIPSNKLLVTNILTNN